MTAIRDITLGCALVCLLAAQSGGLAAAPTIVRVLDSRPDRGNRERAAFLTGPTTPIERLYNEDLEISLWNGPQALTFSVAKNDVWDRRYFGDNKRVITLDDVRRVCFSGAKIGRSNTLGLANTAQALYPSYDFPCPKPVGQIIIRCPDLREPAEYVAGKAADAAVVARASKGQARAATWSVLHRTGNLLIVRGECEGLTAPIQVQLYRHKDTSPQESSLVSIIHYGGDTGYDYRQDRPHNGPLPAPEAGAEGRVFWVRQRFHAEKTFPKGFECVMMALLDGPAYSVAADSHATGAGEQATLHPIDPQVYKRLPGWIRQKRMAIERVNHAESGALATATLGLSARSFDLLVAVVTTRDSDDPLAAAKKMLLDARAKGADAMMGESAAASDSDVRGWRNSRVMHYNATSCTYADSTPWHGDYHFNEGHFLSRIVEGKADTIEQRLLMFEDMVPALKRNAHEVFRAQGICFPLVHYPIKHDRVVYGNVTWEFGIENTGLMLQPYWQIYQYTQDKEFLRTRAYPMMRAGADFYSSYVTEGDDGCYHVIPTVSQEHWGLRPEWRLNRDSVGALSFTKYHLTACIQASEILGVDAAERGKWRRIVERLAPYPTLQTKDGLVFCDVRDAPKLLNYNITANLVMVLWAEDISLDSPPDLLEMARRSYRAIPDREHSMRKGYLSRIRLYLGMLDRPMLCPQGRVLSWPGRIHLYAGVPKGFRVNDRFEGLLAVGGFEVSAMHFGEQVRRVRITSHAGRVCNLKNPWHPEAPHVVDRTSSETVPHALAGDTVTFATDPGHTYAVLSPAEVRRAEIRFMPREKVVAMWTFERVKDGVVPDESGCGHQARLLKGAVVARTGEGQALRLAGPESYASVPRTSAFDFAANESFSVQARVRIGAVADPYMVPLVCSMASKQYCLFLRNGFARFYLSSPRGDVFACVNGRTSVVDGEWHTIRAVRNVREAALELYVDGKLDGDAGDATAGDFAASAPITIGAYLWGDRSRYAQGLIDDVKIMSLGKLEEGEASGR